MQMDFRNVKRLFEPVKRQEKLVENGEWKDRQHRRSMNVIKVDPNDQISFCWKCLKRPKSEDAETHGYL